MLSRPWQPWRLSQPSPALAKAPSQQPYDPTQEKPDPHCVHRPSSSPLSPHPDKQRGSDPGEAGNNGQGQKTQHCSQDI